MKRNLLRSAGIAVTIVSMMGAGGEALYAIDSNNRYFAYGLGQRSCADYVKFREKRLDTLDRHPRYTKSELYEIVDKVIEHWIAGFLTAHNFYVSDTYDVAGKSNIDDVKARLQKTCEANTNQHVAEAMITVVQQLNPTRTRASEGK